MEEDEYISSLQNYLRMMKSPQCHMAASLIGDLNSRLESLEKDAVRYRLASEQDNFCDFVIHAFGCYCDDKAGADRVIDTAMQANKGG